jgi:hypothetical protein
MLVTLVAEKAKNKTKATYTGYFVHTEKSPMLGLVPCAPQMLVQPLPSHTLTLARPAYAQTPETVHAGSFAPRSRLFPTDDLVSLIADAPRESCHASCTGEIMARIDDATRQQTNLLLFAAWLHFVLLVASMRD